MAVDRRNFIRKLGAAAGSIALSTAWNPLTAAQLEDRLAPFQNLNPEACAAEESFWQEVRLAYTVSSTLLDLNSGGVSPQPKVVQDSYIKYYQLSNDAPSFFMWRVLDKGRDEIRQKLADLA